MESLFIFMNLMGDVKVEESADAQVLDKDPLWTHIGTIEPKAYVCEILNKNAKLVAAFRRGQTG